MNLGVPFRPSSWSALNPQEVPQTFENFLEQWQQAGIPRGRRNVLAVSIQTSLSTKWPEVRKSALSVIAAYFGLPVRLSQLTLEYLEKHPKRQTQVQSHTIVRQLASDVRSEDLGVVGIIAEDLCPTDQGNFAFGECAMDESWCIVSSHRLLENISQPDLAQQLRFFKVLTHEIGHLLGLPHCVDFECNMNGKNCLTEVDKDPFDLCPECTAKICFACNFHVHERATRLQEIMWDLGFASEADYFSKVAELTSPNAVVSTL